MANIEVKISEATDAQLLDFARNVLNLDVDGRNSRATVITQIKAVHDGDTITVADAETGLSGKASDKPDGKPEDIETQRRKRQQNRANRQLGDAGSSPMPMQGAFDVPHYEIELMKAQGPDGDAPVEVWVNGRLLVIPRAQRVEIPGPFLTALQNAVMVEFQQGEKFGDNGREVVTTSFETPRYNFRIVRGPYYPDAKAA